MWIKVTPTVKTIDEYLDMKEVKNEYRNGRHLIKTIEKKTIIKHPKPSTKKKKTFCIRGRIRKDNNNIL